MQKCYHCGGDVRNSEYHLACGKVIHADNATCQEYHEDRRGQEEAKRQIDKVVQDYKWNMSHIKAEEYAATIRKRP